MDTPDPDPLITHDEFLSLESLAELKSLYRQRGFEGEDQALLRQAQLDWHQAALEQARQVTEKPAELEPIVCRKDEVTYHVYGVIHGLLGGDNKEYKSFIDGALQGRDWLLFENGLNLYYRVKNSETMPDFTVLGWTGEIALGLRLIFQLPGLLLDLIVELLKLRRRTGDLLDFDIRYHALHPETRRGIEAGTLPSRLQIEYEMEQWDRGGFFSKLKDPFAIVPRSMFMAGFAQGCAERTKRDTIPIVVGDLHATEVQRFLEGSHAQHPIWRQGKSFALRSGPGRLLAWVTSKTRYLLLAALPAVLTITALMVVLAEALHALKTP